MRLYKVLFIAILFFSCGNDDGPGYQEPYNPNDDDDPVVIDPLTDEEIMDLTQETTFRYFDLT